MKFNTLSDFLAQEAKEVSDADFFSFHRVTYAWLTRNQTQAQQ